MATLMGTKTPKVEWMCRYCGQRSLRFKSNGRPFPGHCPRRKSDLPHSWVKNREFRD